MTEAGQGRKMGVMGDQVATEQIVDISDKSAGIRLEAEDHCGSAVGSSTVVLRQLPGPSGRSGMGAWAWSWGGLSGGQREGLRLGMAIRRTRGS